MAHTDFEFLDDENGGQFVIVDGPLVQLRQLLARGEVDPAVRIYEDSGSTAREQLIAEAKTASFDLKKAIAMLFRKARDFSAAARAFQSAKLEADAAESFEQATEFLEAAACWLKVGEVVKAAAAFERGGKVENALELYRKAGAPERIAECLARAHRYAEAAHEFQKLGNAHAEFEVLRSGMTAEPNNLDLLARMGEFMLQHQRKEQAAQVLVDASRRMPEARDHARFLSVLAAALDAVGNAAGAQKVRARVQELPKQVTAPVAPVAPASAPAVAPAAGGLDARPDAYGFLKALPMFAELSIDDMKALYRACALQAFQPGQHLIETGQPGRGLFIIVEGQVEVFAGADKNARLLNTLGVGGYLGEISLVQEGPTSARVTARSAVKALFISRDAFHRYMYGAPNAALRIYRLFTINLAERVRALSAAK